MYEFLNFCRNITFEKMLTFMRKLTAPFLSDMLRCELRVAIRTTSCELHFNTLKSRVENQKFE